MNETTWSNLCPSGRTYRNHLTAMKLPDDDPAPDKPTLVQIITTLGGGPIRTHSGLAALLDTCELGFSVDDGLEPDTCVVGKGNKLRVTGLYA